MKIAITGANGYIGSHVTKQLIEMGHEVTACDVNTDNIDTRAEIKKTDIFNVKLEDNVFKDLGEPDVCLHLAWRDGFVHNSTKHISDLSGHFNFINNITDNGLKHLAVMGTMHEVGYHEGMIDEATPCRPLSLYGIAKNALRQSSIVVCQQKKCTLQWLRGFYIYGDDLKNHSIFTTILEAAERGDKKFPFTSGKNMYDFMTVDNLVKQIAATVTQNKVNGIINCCSGKPATLKETVENFIKQHNLNIELDYGAYPDRPYDSPCIYGDDTKIKEIMG